MKLLMSKNIFMIKLKRESINPCQSEVESFSDIAIIDSVDNS